MTMSTTYRRHAELVDRMGDALGLDLEEKTFEGQLSLDTLSDVVLRCTGCADPDGCEHWLAAQDGIAEHAPSMCRNGDIFELLKQGKRV